MAVSDETFDSEGGHTYATFESLHAATFQHVVAYCRRRAPTVEDADDIVAEVFIVAWRKQSEVCSADSPLAWLYGVAWRTLSNHRRTLVTRQRLVEVLRSPQRQGHSVDPCDVVSSKEQAEELLDALSRLKETDRELLRLAAFEQLSHAEIGAVLGIRAGAVRGRLYKARQRLRSRMRSPRRDRTV